jgi:valine--pyruvate aminotransferase
MCQLNGGSPADIPEIKELWRSGMRRLLDDGEFDMLVGKYAHPAGDPRFTRALANYLRDRCGWDIGPENIAITQGGQMACFTLFNMLAGYDRHGNIREILFPLCPDYVGYQSQSLCGGAMFRGIKPDIRMLDEHTFKYAIDFDRLDIRPETAAICLSRPANPTGNVVTDEELDKLRALAKEAGIPLIIDNAYGPPLPNICFVPVNPAWDENMILSMSLSKIGLPGTRTGIVIARPEIIRAVVSMVTTSALCPNNLGQALVTPFLEDGTLEHVCHDILTPFYQERSEYALSLLPELFGNEIPWRVHKSEGAMFLWLWFEGLPITAQKLYERCKERGCFINPGHHFFFALPDLGEVWSHRYECIRISYTQNQELLRKGLSIVADEVKKAYSLQ